MRRRRTRQPDIDTEKLVNVLDVIGPAAPMPADGLQHSSAPTRRKPSEIEQYARSVFETALYLSELAISDGGGGHSVALREIKPQNIADWSAPRRVLSRIRSSAPGPQGDVSLLEVCRWVAELDGEGCAPAPYTFHQIERLAREKCEWWEPQALRRAPTDSDDDFSYATGLMASARYLHRIYLEGIEMGGGHSRLDLFVRQHLRAPGTSRKWEAKSATVDSMDRYEQDEHVVPCAFIRDNCLRQYAQGASVAQVANYIGRHMVIVKLLKEESICLDASPENGGYGLKTTMPKGWRVGVDSIFARLHFAEIKFTPPAWFKDN